jgi:small subunit ribosomal protein S17
LDYWIIGLVALINPAIHSSLHPRFDMADTNSSTAVSTGTPIASAPEAARAKRKERVGEVISNKMAKTIIVQVERRFAHARYKKVVTGYKKLYAHDEKSEAKVGDRVRIEETRPLSKTKRWRLVEVVAKGSGVSAVAV